MPHLLDQTREQLESWLAERGQPKYRAAQVRRWLFRETVADFEAMTDLSRSLRHDLASDFSIWSSRVAAHKVSEDGTEKLLLKRLKRDSQQV